MMNLRSILFLAASFSVALFLIAYGPKWADRFGRSFDTPPATQPKTGDITLSEGKVSKRSYGANQFLDIKGPSELHHLDTVQVQARSHVELDLNQNKLSVHGPAMIVVEMWNQDADGPIVLHLLSGQLQMVKEGPPGKLFVVQKGEITDAKGASVPRERRLLVTPLNIGEPPSAPVLPTPTLSPPVAPADDDTENNLITNEYLDAQIAQQKDQFQKCQNNALREQGEVKGQILVGLTISPEGKVSNVRILASTLQDEKLHSCVLQVFDRLKFKTFNGAPIVRSYPLNFE